MTDTNTKMQSLILYASYGTKGRQTGLRVAGAVIGKYDIFVRSEKVEADVANALDFAAPRPGEIVLNAIPYHD